MAPSSLYCPIAHSTASYGFPSASRSLLPCPVNPIWTAGSRIVRFSRPRHNEFASRAALPAHSGVIAISGEYEGSPEVIAGAFFQQCPVHLRATVRKDRGIIGVVPLPAQLSKPDRAPAWVPKSDAGYFVVTCTECLRSFSVPDDRPGNELHQTNCFFRDAPVRYLADVQLIRKKAPQT